VPFSPWENEERAVFDFRAQEADVVSKSG